jgi:pimeloyl-ACP methyl ester carboxylesterase
MAGMKGLKGLAAAGAAAGALGASAYAAYCCRILNKPVPPRAELEDYLLGLMRQTGQADLEPLYREGRLFREDTLKAGGRELRLYLFESQPSDPVVVFIPGTSVYALVYVELLHKLRNEGFNVIGFDPRGHGLSAGRRGVYTLGALVEDSMAVISYAVENYGGKVGMAGSSQGGMAAFYTAAADRRLKAAVCHNLIAPDEPDNYRMTRWPAFFHALTALIPLTRLVPQALKDRLMTPVAAYLDLAAEPSRLYPDVKAWIRSDPLTVNGVSLSALISLTSEPIARRVEEIDTPVMVIHSGGDNIFPEDYVRRVFARLTCDKELLYLPGRPHLVTIDYVDEVLPATAAWFGKHLR